MQVIIAITFIEGDRPCVGVQNTYFMVKYLFIQAGYGLQPTSLSIYQYHCSKTMHIIMKSWHIHNTHVKRLESSLHFRLVVFKTASLINLFHVDS
jgi:hypothetical protein